MRGRVAGVGRPLSPSYLAHILGHLMAALGYLLLGLHSAMWLTEILLVPAVDLMVLIAFTIN